MEKSEWQGSAGETWAAEWRRTDRSFAGVTEQLLRRVSEFRFSRVLDVGCGAGELSLAIARGHHDATVRGVDVSPQLVEASCKRGNNLANVSFALGDAGEWQPDDGFCPDLLVSRHGVMFFDDPPAAFANLAGLAADGAHLLFSCFRSPAENPFFTEIASLLPAPPTPPPPGSPGPFAFGDPERVRSILSAGGWTDIDLQKIDFGMVVGAGDDPVADAVDYFAAIGPAAVAAREMEDGDRDAFFSRVRKVAEAHCADGIVAFPGAGWIVTARKA